MENYSPPNAEATGWLDTYRMVRAFWSQVRIFDGQPMRQEWMFADVLFSVARHTLEQHYAPNEAPTSMQQQILVALEDVRQHAALARHDGFMHPHVPSDWLKLQACLGRALPLVERLLLG